LKVYYVVITIGTGLRIGVFLNFGTFSSGLNNSNLILLMQ